MKTLLFFLLLAILLSSTSAFAIYWIDLPYDPLWIPMKGSDPVGIPYNLSSWNLYSSAGPTSYKRPLHPWRAQMVVTEPVALECHFTSRNRPNQSVEMMNWNTKTYPLLSGQRPAIEQGSPSCHEATIRVFVTGPSIGRDPYESQGYEGYFQGGGIATEPWNYYGDPMYTGYDLNFGHVVQRTPANSGVNFANFGRIHFKQSDYPDKPYGKNSGYMITHKGCYLNCVAGSLCAQGFSTDPVSLNNSLAREPDGYIQKVLVNPLAVVRLYKGALGYLRNVPLEEALARNLEVQVSVKNNSHWVKVIGVQIDNENLPHKFRMLDPAYLWRGYWTLREYGGVNTNNTRCFYRKHPWYILYPKKMSEVDWGSSGIIAGTKSNVNLTLNPIGSMSPLSTERETQGGFSTCSIQPLSMLQPASVSQSEIEYIENAETGELGEAIRVLEAKPPSGNYFLRISGSSGTPYDVDLFNYDDASDWIFGAPMSNIGVIPESGFVDIAVPHLLTAKFGAVVNPETLADGTKLEYLGLNAVITGVVPGVGIYLQEPRSSIRPMFVKYASAIPDLFGRKVSQVKGQVITDVTEKLVDSGEVWIDYYSVPTLPTPVGTSPEIVSGRRGTWHFYSRTWGRVTESAPDHIVLNGKLKVWVSGADLPVGSFIQLDGVEHKGEFIVGKLDSVKRLQ